jgi:hypothetical protein
MTDLLDFNWLMSSANMRPPPPPPGDAGGATNGLRRPQDRGFVCEPLTRAFEESMMRAPRAGERPCIKDEDCICRKIPGYAPGFTAVELVPPYIMSQHRASARAHAEPWPERRYTCVLDTHIDVCDMYAYRRSLNRPADGDVQISYFYNVVNREGEYPLEACIADARFGLMQPVVLFVASNYVPYQLPDGTPALRQMIGRVVQNPF